MGEVNGPGTVQGGEKFLTGTESVEHSAKSGGHLTVAGKAKVGEIIESDRRSMISLKLLANHFLGCISF